MDEVHVKTVLISIGSNQGDSVAIARGAIRDLRGFAAQCFRASSLWRTSPVNCPPGSPDFINASVAFTPHCDETPESLLAFLQRLLALFGFPWRTRSHERLLLPVPF